MDRLNSKKSVKISVFVPKIIYNSFLNIKKKPAYKKLKLTLLYLDISGFTRLSETLSSMGKEGSEEITSIINTYFGNLAEIVLFYGGDIYRFAGDAIIAFFHDNTPKSNAENALKCALKAIQLTRENRIVYSTKGNFEIGLHIGLASGEVFFKDLGIDFILAGKTAKRVYMAVDKAQRWEIVADTPTKRLLKDISFERVGKILFRVKNPGKTLRAFSNDIPSTPVLNVNKDIVGLKNYIDKRLIERIGQYKSVDSESGEHRKVTIVFLHFKGIDYLQHPLKSSKVIQSLYQSIYKISEKYGGYINKIDFHKKGERMLILFGLPDSQEKDEEKGCMFAKELFETMNKNRSLSDIKLSMGIHSGYVFATLLGSNMRMEYTVMGDNVNFAARIAADAKENTLLVSNRIKKQCENNFVFSFYGYRKFKGKSGLKPIFKLKTNRTYTPSTPVPASKTESDKSFLIGREKELKIIRQIIRKVHTEKGQFILLKGDAGIGKSKLMKKSADILKDASFSVYWGTCFSYNSNIAYYPWIQVLSLFFNFKHTDTIYAKRRKIKEKIRDLCPAYSDWVILVENILGLTDKNNKKFRYLDAKLRKQKLFDIITNLLKKYSEKRPVALLFEDLHWSDSISIELLNYIAKGLKDTKILLIASVRTEFKGDLTPDHEILLKALSKNHTEQLVKHMLNTGKLPYQLEELIVGKTGGNPFYVEEMLKMLIEKGHMWRNRKNEWHLSANFSDLSLPATVEELILGRIDKLGIKERDTIKKVAVLGKEFTPIFLKALFENTDEAIKLLEKLSRNDFFEPITGGKYTFKHPLIQEVAYENLSYGLKRKLHKKVATFIEKNFSSNIREFIGLLSYHFYRARVYEKAMEYSLMAAKSAKKVYANEEVIKYLNRVTSSFKGVKKTKNTVKIYMEAVEHIVNVLTLVGRNAEALKTAREAIEYAKINAPGHLGNMYMLLSNIYGGMSWFNESLEYARKSLDIFIKNKDLFGMMQSYNNIGFIHRIFGALDRALLYYGKTLTLAKKLKKMETFSNILTNIGVIYSIQGKYAYALKYFEEAYKIKKNIADRQGMATSITSIEYIETLQGKIKPALLHAKKALKIYKEIGDKKGMGSTYHDIGYLYCSNGEVEKGMEYYKKALKIRKEIGDKKGEATTLLNLGTIYSDTGMIEDAIASYTRAAGLYESIKYDAGAANCYNNIGHLYNLLEKKDSAYQYLTKALELYRKTNTQIMEVIALKNIAYTQILNEKYEQAIEILNEAENKVQKMQSPKNLRIKLDIIWAELYLRLKNRDRAKTYVENGLDIIKEGTSLETEGEFKLLEGRLLILEGKYAKATLVLSRALKIFRKIHDKYKTALTLYFIAFSKFKKDKSTKILVINALKEAKEIFKQLNINSWHKQTTTLLLQVENG